MAVREAQSRGLRLLSTRLALAVSPMRFIFSGSFGEVNHFYATVFGATT
jgi:hypothetical protein